MSKPLSEIKESNSIDTIPKYDPSVDRFKDVPAHVFGGEDKNDKTD